MNRGDQLVERGAERVRELSRELAARGGFAAQLADDLAQDSEFLRKLKPSLIMARVRGEAPTGNQPATDVQAPTGPQLGTRPKRPGEGVNPFVLVGAAFVVGIVLAKVIDWRGHAHPRDS